MNPLTRFFTEGITDRDAPFLYSRDTVRTVWDEKLEETIPPLQEQAVKQALQASAARKALGRIMKIEKEIEPTMIVHPYMPFMRAIYDAHDWDTGMIARIIRKTSSTPTNGVIPRDFWIELQHQMIVGSATEALFVLADAEDNLEITRVLRDRKFASNHTETCIRFWDYVLRGESPEFANDIFQERSSEPPASEPL